MFYGAIMLTGANLLLRLVGMGFQVYLSSRTGAAGIGLLQLVLAVTGLFFTLGSAGIRTCSMYLTAEELGRKRLQGVRAVLTGCSRYSLVCSAAMGILLWHFAPLLSVRWIGDLAAAPSLRLYALSLPVRCMEGVLTGFFTAANRIRALVAVQFLEQGCAIAVTSLLLARWAGTDAGRSCLAVTAGSCGAAVLSLLALAMLCRGKASSAGKVRQRPPYGRIFPIALPLAVADGLRSGLGAVEHLIIPKRLSLFAGTVNALADYGVIHGMVFPVLMFPAAILFSLSELLVPELSRCAAVGSRERVRYLARRSLRLALLFGLAAGGVLFAGAEALGELLFHEPMAGTYLRLYAPFVPMLYLDAVVDAMCKGLGQQKASARYNVLTTFLDVAFLWLLLPRFGLAGYYFSFAVTHLVNFALSLRRLTIASGTRPAWSDALRASLCAVFACAVTALLPPWAGLPGILLPGSFCLVLLCLTWGLLRVVSGEDLMWLKKLAVGRR
jgi:stage V sporulation protein B